MSNNLIDLSVEETNSVDCKSSPNSKKLLPSKHITPISNYLLNTNNNFIDVTTRDSLDNNPFDKIQKQIDLLGDPFESVEIAASNSYPNFRKEHEVRTENLLSLQEDEILTLTPGPSTLKENNFSGLSEISKNSPDFQSTPISLNISSTPQKPSLMKHKLKNNLLKLSISNASSYLSSRRDSKTSDEESPMTVMRSKDKNNLMNSLTSSKDDSCDDLMNTKPNWVDSETDCESDLEMMKIPMLDKIDDKTSDSPNQLAKEQPQFRSRFNSEGSISHLAAIREKMVSRRSVEKSQNKSIDEMNEIINEFKNIILERKVKPSSVLESLKNAFSVEENSSDENPRSSENRCEDTPPPIIRQGTFDTELEDASHLPDADKDICLNQTNININDMEKIFKTPPGQQSINSVFKQLGKFFGTPNLNIVKTNFNPQNPVNSAPTYIVLMNNSQAVENNSEKEIEPTVRRRSQSLSIPSKKSSVNKLQEKPKVSSTKMAPPKLIRRNSMASTSTHTPQPRRSISNLNSKSLTFNNSNTLSNVQRKSAVSNPKPQLGSYDLQAKRLKFKSNENIASRGPIRATIPIKNLAKAIAKTPAKDRQNFDKLNICTPVTRQNFPKASSTPMVMTPEINLLRRNRSGFLSSPKSNLSFANRRRTMTAAGSTTEVLPRPTATPKPNLVENKTKISNISYRFKTTAKSNPIKNKENNNPQ